MKKANLKFISIGCGLISILFSTVGCSSKPKTDYILRPANEDLFASTINSIVSTDVYGRSFNEGDVATSDKKVGMFYFIWLGEHTNNGIFDVTEFSKTEEGVKELWDRESKVSLLNEFHYFSQPLYGYYCSDDPWVLTRHIELLTMSGVDYISLDLTNLSIYEKNVTAVLEKLLEFQNKGWNVPKVTTFLTGTYKAAGHPERVLKFYNTFYTNPRYDSLWLRDDASGKPIISLDWSSYYDALSILVTSNLKIKNTIWPYNTSETIHDDASWMDWEYPQRVYENSDGNYMSVSVAQHVAGSFGMSVNPNLKDKDSLREVEASRHKSTYHTGSKTNHDANRGRGWNYELNQNVAEDANKGTNFEAQWSNALNSTKPVDEVFITGWNEWIAYKSPLSTLHTDETVYGSYYDQVSFCDTCNEEFSRDIEMTKDGYGDNFYLQNMRLTRKFKDSNNIRYAGSYATKSLRNLKWTGAREYLDFTGDAIAREFDRADHKEKYINTTNRNDIYSTKLCHDDKNLYIQINTLNNIIIDSESNNNLNLLLSIQNSKEANWNGYHYILNRNIKSGVGTTQLEKVVADGEFNFKSVCECETYLDGKTMSIAIPLESLGVNVNDGFTIDFKVADGISDPSNIINYYIDGDSAPIGRLNYRYNSLLIK